VGDGGSCNLKPVRIFRTFCCAREQQNELQEQSCSGSRNQLPITVTILLSASVRVDSPPGSFFSVLPDTLAGLFLVPMYLRKFFAPPFESGFPRCLSDV
jgi:hypothetical protein